MILQIIKDTFNTETLLILWIHPIVASNARPCSMSMSTNVAVVPYIQLSSIQAFCHDLRLQPKFACFLATAHFTCGELLNTNPNWCSRLDWKTVFFSNESLICDISLYPRLPPVHHHSRIVASLGPDLTSVCREIGCSSCAQSGVESFKIVTSNAGFIVVVVGWAIFFSFFWTIPYIVQRCVLCGIERTGRGLVCVKKIHTIFISRIEVRMGVGFRGTRVWWVLFVVQEILYDFDCFLRDKVFPVRIIRRSGTFIGLCKCGKHRLSGVRVQFRGSVVSGRFFLFWLCMLSKSIDFDVLAFFVMFVWMREFWCMKCVCKYWGFSLDNRLYWNTMKCINHIPVTRRAESFRS